MKNLKPPRGTYDILPQDHRRHCHVGDTAEGITALYGFEEMATPIFESTDVFSRTLGETSDVVTKEMYAFEDKKGRPLALRPEGTAGVARAFICGLRSEPLPLKLFYRGAMFRYERMQKGRQRQFHQFGVELLGVAEPAADVETVVLGAHVLDALGLTGKVSLQLNSLGDTETRTAYRRVLVDFLSAHKSDLSEDSLDRLERNPLRVLDSKDPGDKAVVAGAPKLSDHLNAASEDFFAAVTKGLDASGVRYEINPTLVRGLDYYCHTAFEFVTDTLGAQGTVLAGGRYDGLIETMGGPSTPGVGWAAGVERIAMMIDEPPAPIRSIAVVPVGDDGQAEGQVLAGKLRRAGFAVEFGFSGNLKKRLSRANKAGARAAVIIGDDEMAKGMAKVQNMETGDQADVEFSSLEDHLARYR